METKHKDLYFVAAKLFLRHGNKLLITHDIFKSWDLPGGRIKTDEFETPLEAIIERKVHEELGHEVTYKLGGPSVFFRVERVEESTGERVRIFGIGYDAAYTGGKIALGRNHDTYEWVDVTAFEPKQRFVGGWLKGVEEYLARQ